MVVNLITDAFHSSVLKMISHAVIKVLSNLLQWILKHELLLQCAVTVTVEKVRWAHVTMADAVGVPEPEAPMFSGNSVCPRLDVYVWDMDETLVLLNSLLKSSYAEAFNGLKDVQKGVEIGRMWENLILQTCDDYFFYEQVKFGLCVEIAMDRFACGMSLIDLGFLCCRLKITISHFLMLWPNMMMGGTYLIMTSTKMN